MMSDGESTGVTRFSEEPDPKSGNEHIEQIRAIISNRMRLLHGASRRSSPDQGGGTWSHSGRGAAVSRNLRTPVIVWRTVSEYPFRELREDRRPGAAR
jgi:hypothetical protein